MEKNLDEKIEILKRIDTDDSRFLYRICIAYKKYKEELNKKIKEESFEISDKKTDVENGLINLNDIYCEPYYNTKMKKSIKRMVEDILNIDSEVLINNKNICKKIIYKKVKEEKEPKDNSKYDIVELIKYLNEKQIKNIKLFANNISEENIFKYEQLKNAIYIINIEDIKKRNEFIYDYTYNYLKKDFISNNYCDFKNDKCIAQRHFNLFPVSRKDGCCFKQISKCEHLNKGNCNVECMACRLFVCPYLTKRGVGYWGSEFVLLNAFFSKKQRKHLIFDFYESKENILKNLDK